MKVTWQCEIRSGNGSITAFDDFLVVCSIGITPELEVLLTCFSQANGDIVWQKNHKRLCDKFLDNSSTAPRGIPVIAKNSLTYVSNRGELTNLHGNSVFNMAQESWEVDLVSKLGVFKRDDLEIGTPGLTPTIIDDKVIVATGNGSTLNMHDRARNVPAPLAPAWASFELKNGNLLWTNNEPSAAVVHSNCSNPVALSSDCLIASGGDGALYVLNKVSGKTMAKYSDSWFWSWSSPSVVSENVLIASSDVPGDFNTREPSVSCFSVRELVELPLRASPIWKFTDTSYKGSWFSPCVLGTSVFVLSQQNDLIEISLESGRLISFRELGSHEMVRPQVLGDHVLVANANQVESFSANTESPNEIYVLPDYIDGNFTYTNDRIFVAGQTTLRCYERLEREVKESPAKLENEK